MDRFRGCVSVVIKAKCVITANSDIGLDCALWLSLTIVMFTIFHRSTCRILKFAVGFLVFFLFSGIFSIIFSSRKSSLSRKFSFSIIFSSQKSSLLENILIISIECDDDYGKEIEKLIADKEYTWKYRVWNSIWKIDLQSPTIWRSWLSLRTICTHNKYNYSYEQACYHYSKNRSILEKEVLRCKEHTFEQHYDWLDDFNKDPHHYRLSDDE